MGYKFKSDKKRKDFKSEDAYLSYVYEQNKEKIDAVRVKKGDNEYMPLTKEMFINQVKARKIINNTNVSGALNDLGKTVGFTPVGERAKENILKGLRSHDKYGEFRNLLRDEKGHYQKVDLNNLKWNSDIGGYIYSGFNSNYNIQIIVKNSPITFEVIRCEKPTI